MHLCFPRLLELYEPLSYCTKITRSLVLARTTPNSPRLVLSYLLTFGGSIVINNCSLILVFHSLPYLFRVSQSLEEEELHAPRIEFAAAVVSY
jgi:hypothetical protein